MDYSMTQHQIDVLGIIFLTKQITYHALADMAGLDPRPDKMIDLSKDQAAQLIDCANKNLT